MKLNLLSACLTALSCCALSAQSHADLYNRQPGQLLVQVKPGEDIEVVFRSVRQSTAGDLKIWHVRTPAPDWHVHLIGYEEGKIDANALLGHIRSLPSVQCAQYNHRSQSRDKTPNDVDWTRQTDMSLIKMPESWDYSTGGLMTSRGLPAPDTIVVAVLEKGAMLTHPDLMPNRWYNYAEIPDNNIDDDNNGFVDDFEGWNPKRQSDSINPRRSHGTSVNAIIGAKGNNSIGVSGVNWNIKLMNFSEIVFEDEIVEAYYYAGKMRKAYNESNGAKGAFVVASNASFGLDNSFPEDFPLWCAAYDSIGRVGIISVGATSNTNVNVDVQGDMPTTCKSEFLITVTNTDNLGNKIPSAGYGSKSIDLGAPGDDSYTCESSEGLIPEALYGVFGGTSAACPHVTGTVAFLYSLGCAQFTNDALSDPVACARRVRDVILDNVAPEESLSEKTTSAGYLNVENAIKGIFEICDGSVGNLDFIRVERSIVEAEGLRVYYQTPNFFKYKFRVFNSMGQLMLENIEEPKEFQENYVEFSTAHYPSGSYVMVFSVGKSTVAKKFRVY
jgi:serine protease